MRNNNYVCDICGSTEDCTIADSYMGEVIACEDCRSYKKEDNPYRQQNAVKALKKFERELEQLKEMVKLRL